MTLGDIILGLTLILIGLAHIVRPKKIEKLLRESYKGNPFFKNKKQLKARPSLWVIFGMVWILAGVEWGYPGVVHLLSKGIMIVLGLFVRASLI